MKWEENVRKVVPYVPGEQPRRRVIKLNTNECPYPPAPGVQAALKQMDAEQLRLYPDPLAKDLVGAIAAYYHMEEEQVFVGVGSDDVLGMAFLTFFNGKEPILFPDITYSFYDVWADLYRIPYEICPLNEKLEIDPADYERTCGGVVIANPNAPTGAIQSVSNIERIIKANQDVIVIVDEAYIDFGGESALPLIEKYDNVLVVQTFSKSRAMAGMRIGYAFGNPKLIRYMNDVKFSYNSYTMNRPSILLGVKAIEDDAYFKEITGKIVATREWTKKELAALGFTFPDSKTNFVFASHKSVPAKEIFEALKEKDIYVRYWDKDRINNSLRITIGTDGEMKELVAFLKSYLAERV